MNPLRNLDALAMAGERVLFSVDGRNAAPGHDIPHPIGDPDEDEGLPGEDDEDEGEEDEDYEEPMHLGRGAS